jgi:uncharacterized protein (DUF924 family)
MDPNVNPADIVDFWREAGPERWFRVDSAFDDRFRERFFATHLQAAAGELRDWEATADGALALVLLLDQFPRNAFRGTPRVYATDLLAKEVSARAIEQGHDRVVGPDLRSFFYLPFQHSESLADQDRCVELARELGGDALRWAEHHRGIVERFGRFPHRNEVLKRESTAAELRFIEHGGFKG